jgi:hypothetical protein
MSLLTHQLLLKNSCSTGGMGPGNVGEIIPQIRISNKHGYLGQNSGCNGSDRTMVQCTTHL